MYICIHRRVEYIVFNLVLLSVHTHTHTCKYKKLKLAAFFCRKSCVYIQIHLCIYLYVYTSAHTRIEERREKRSDVCADQGGARIRLGRFSVSLSKRSALRAPLLLPTLVDELRYIVHVYIHIYSSPLPSSRERRAAALHCYSDYSFRGDRREGPVISLSLLYIYTCF